MRNQPSQIGRIVYTRKLGPAQQNVKQIVIAHLEKLSQGGHIGIGELVFEMIKKLCNDQVVFQQTTACAPPETRTLEL